MIVKTVMRNHEVLETDVWVRQDHCTEHLGRHFDGSNEIQYEYDMYYFSDKQYVLCARSYIDSPEAASFAGLEVKGESRFLVESDFQLPFIKTAIEYLIFIGKTDITWLSRGRDKGGYLSVPNVG